MSLKLTKLAELKQRVAAGEKEVEYINGIDFISLVEWEVIKTKKSP